MVAARKIACAVGLLVGALAVAHRVSAHPVTPRTRMPGFIRRANVIVRGRVVEATRPRRPRSGRFPVITRVEVEKSYKGTAPKRVVVLGWSHHAVSYREGERAIFFLQGDPKRDSELQSDLRQGEELKVTPVTEASWDRYLTAAIAAVDHPGETSKQGHRQALREALRAPAPTLRRRALTELISTWSSESEKHDLEGLLEAARESRLPMRFRVAVLRAAASHLDVAGLERLTREGPAALRGRALLAWAGRTRRHKEWIAQVRATAERWLSGPTSELRLYAASTLARLGRATGLKVLRRSLIAPGRKGKRLVADALLRLASRGNEEARNALRDAAATHPDRRLRRWLSSLVSRLPPPRKPRAKTRARVKPTPSPRTWIWWVVLAAGVASIAVGLFLWRRKRS